MTSLARRQATEPAESRSTPAAPSQTLGPHLRRDIADDAVWTSVPALLAPYYKLTSGNPTLSTEMKERLRAEVARASAALPDTAELQAMVSAACPAQNPATSEQIAQIVGAMLDGIATFSVEKAPGYVDALLMSVEIEAQRCPFTARALAKSCFAVLCAERFAPAPNDLLAALRKERDAQARSVETLKSVCAAVAACAVIH